MKRNKRREKRILTILLCWVLCAANIIPTGLTVWAGEPSVQSEPTAEGDKGGDQEIQEGSAPAENPGGESGQQPDGEGEDSGEDSAPENPPVGEEGDEGAKQPENPEIPENPENPENPETPEIPEEGGDTPQEPGEDVVPENPEETEMPKETETPEEVPEEGEIKAETAGKLDAEENSLLSTTEVPAGAIAHGEYKENGSDTVWYINKNGKLVVEGTGEVSVPEYSQDNSLRYIPWEDYTDKIKTAEIKVTGMTDASYLFFMCESLTKVDVSGFDTSQVKNMNHTFAFCNNLTELDVSHFDTSNITIMKSMFQECRQLTNLDVSGFNTSNVTDMSNMFDFCENLTSLDVSRFNTSKATNMAYMFGTCEKLTSLDVSSFDTSKVTNMEGMFEQCKALTNLDISNFDTSQVTDMNRMFCFLLSMERLDLHTFNTANVTDMGEMFLGCYKMKALDLSSFDTAKVTNMNIMFASCNVLSELDLSSFDTSRVTDMSDMFNSCDALSTLDLRGFDVGNVTKMDYFLSRSADSHQNLKVIYTPKNLKISVPLEHYKNNSSDAQESETWYMADGTAIQELPKNLDYSIVITKDKPTSPITASITASKKKTAYQCGDTLNVDDITVLYHDSKGAIRTITQGFTTNASEIDMSTPGKKKLIVTYTEPDTNTPLTAEIELTVTLAMSDSSVEVTLSQASYAYNSRQQKPTPTVTLKGSTSDALTFGTDYTVSYKDNVNAGSAAVVINGVGVYSGTVEKTFTITPAEVTIRVEDTTIAVGDAVPETFACEMTGFYNGDEEKVTEITFSYTDAAGNTATVSTDKTGTYTITPGSADVGGNYTVGENGYLPGTLTVAEERVIYIVTFNMMGHGTDSAVSVRSGQLITEPAVPTADGFVFEGWYKDQACTKAWNFTTDTVQENTTLYARWRAQTSQGGISIQEISDQTYTGNAIKPVPAVFDVNGTLLKSGRDYTVKYVNNVNVDQKDAAGGVSDSLEAADGNANTFSRELPYVEIKGKGNHTGTVYRNFHIRQAAIGDGKGSAATGITLKYTDQFVTNQKKEQKPFSSLKYKKAMKAGTDFTVTLTSSDAYDADGNAVRGTDGGAWSVAGTTDSKNRYVLPGIPKGYSGVFEMVVTAKGNYTGEIRKTVYVTNADKLIKNAAVTVGKNLKNRPYDEGRAVRLTPGYYDSKNRKYYAVNAQGEWENSAPAADGNDLFTVKKGNTYLLFGRDYTVTYANNKAVGTATMTVNGIGEYKGSKSVTFKITGAAFKANTIDVKAYDLNNPNENDFRANMPYTGCAVTQNKVTLTTKKTTANPDVKTLDYGRHYTITYKNNIKKGTATMTFTAKPESGYSGKFNKTFKIGAVPLADSNSVKVEAVSAENGQYSLSNAVVDNKGVPTYGLTGTVTYTREGAKPSRHICLSLVDGKGQKTGVVLKEGTDYTVKYANNTVLVSSNQPAKIPTMTFTGKGNYTGSLKVTFSISEAAMEQGAANLAVSAASVAFNDRKKDDYMYQPKITIKDGKKTLSNNKDYTVEYVNCSQTAVDSYLKKLESPGTSANAEDGGTAGEDIQQAAPKAVIKAVAGKGYKTEENKAITVYLNVYRTKLTGSNLYVVVSGEASQTTYKGQQVTPSVAVYFGEASAVKAAKKDKVTDETTLTGDMYKLTKLTEKTGAAGDYTLTYGANVAAGKNKGSVTVTGTGLYGGKVTVKFTILNRDVYQAP